MGLSVRQVEEWGRAGRDQLTNVDVSPRRDVR
jgi:hypothetical protein